MPTAARGKAHSPPRPSTSRFATLRETMSRAATWAASSPGAIFWSANGGSTLDSPQPYPACLPHAAHFQALCSDLPALLSLAHSSSPLVWEGLHYGAHGQRGLQVSATVQPTPRAFALSQSAVGVMRAHVCIPALTASALCYSTILRRCPSDTRTARGGSACRIGRRACDGTTFAASTARTRGSTRGSAGRAGASRARRARG